MNSWQSSLTRVHVNLEKQGFSMSIAQSFPSDGGTVADVPITNFTAIQLEALLQACGYALREEESLYIGLIADLIDSLLDSRIIDKLEFRYESRSELIALAGACAHRLYQLETVGGDAA